MSRMLSVLFIVVHVIPVNGDTTVGSSTVSRTSYYQQLRDDLLSRPVSIHKIPPGFLDGKNSSYNISLQLWLADISDIDELNQEITVNVYMDVRWTQEELSWNPSDYDGIDLVLMSSNTIWTPLVLVVMGQDGKDVLQFPATVQLTSDGVVKSTRHNYLTFTCDIDFLRYPFDVQVCNVGFLPTGLNVRPNIKFTDLSNYPLEQFVSIKGEWSLENSHFNVVTTASSEIALFTFSVRRESTYYVITCIFPLVLTSVMIPLTFLVPAETGEKISYLVAMFTSTAIFLNYISDVMPRSLSVMPYLAVLLVEVLMEGLLAVLASVLVVNTHLHEFKRCAHKQDNCESETFTSKKSAEVNKDSSQISRNQPGHVKSMTYILASLKMTSQQMDRTFFILFMTGQLTFLFAIFGLTNWILTK